MSAMQVHPWFKTGLPEGAGVMNTLILREDAMALPRQSAEELRILVKVGRCVCARARVCVGGGGCMRTCACMHVWVGEHQRCACALQAPPLTR